MLMSVIATLFLLLGTWTHDPLVLKTAPGQLDDLPAEVVETPQGTVLDGKPWGPAN